LEAKITLEYADAKTAKAIANAVSPDNSKTPTGMLVKTIMKGTKVVTEIQCENNKILTFTATIDDLLFSASTAEKTLRAIKKI